MSTRSQKKNLKLYIQCIGIREEWGKWATTLDFVEKFGELDSEEIISV